MTGVSLLTPNQTRWNATYDAVEKLLSVKPKLNELCDKLGVVRFTSSDLAYLEEYSKIMRPLANTIDFLQSEKGMYFGYLMPAILSLLSKLEDAKIACRMLRPLVVSIITSVKTRFSYIFDINNDVVVASVLNPNIKLKWMAGMERHGSPVSVEDIKTLIKTKVSRMIDDNEIELHSMFY